MYVEASPPSKLKGNRLLLWIPLIHGINFVLRELARHCFQFVLCKSRHLSIWRVVDRI